MSLSAKSSVLSGIALAATLALAGCSATVNPPDTSLPPPLDCGADALSDDIGERVTGSTAQDVRVGGERVQAAGAVRVIAPGQPVTQDYSPTRLNLDVDSARNLVRPWCG